MRTALSICNDFLSRPALLAAAGVLLSACAGAPLQPEVKLSDAYQQSADGAVAVTGDWWRVFNDPTLDQLIARGLAGNHDARLARGAEIALQTTALHFSVERQGRVFLAASAVRAHREQPQTRALASGTHG